MPRRPPSTAASDRPTTSAGGRPTTARASAQHPTLYAQHAHDPQYTYDEGYLQEEDEEDDESEAEDVFAYLPPTTMEQQAQHQHSEPDHTFAFQPTLEYDEDSPFSHQLTPEPTPAFPNPPAFGAPRVHPTSPVAPSSYYPPSTSAGAPPPTSAGVGVPPLASAESPPSTQSFSGGENDAYRMRRLDTPVSGRPSVSRGSALSSREVHVSLPSTSVVIKETAPSVESNEDEDLGEMEKKPRGPASVVDTASEVMTPSMLEGSEGSIKMDFDFDAIDEEDSPYPEVRASVSNIDDPDMPAMTIRMWLVGLVLCMTGSAMNVFFNFRQPAPQVVALVLLLLSYPCGKFFAYALPITTYRLPRWLGGLEFSLNPGPWNIKEHVLVYIMANVSVGPPYALNAIVVSEMFYHIPSNFWFSLVLVLATQLTGFGLAGLCRRFLVWPASMVWPANLVACTLLNTLHADDDDGTGGVTRYKFFMWVATGSFFFFILPGFLFEALSVFSWVCWIAPKNVPINQLFGVSSGLGMSVLTFDWTQITWIGSPLMVPWWAEVHIFTGFVFFYWILAPILYYTNAWQLSHFPISSVYPYDRFGQQYNVSRVLQADDRFNLTAYEEYSPLYLTTTYAMTYLLAFALSTCVIVHTLLYHGRSLLNGVKRIRVEKDDIHAKLMRNYPEVPDWWYMTAFVCFFALAIVAVKVWHTGVPVWALLLAVLLPIIYVLPSGFIFAMTGQGITVNLLAQIIPATLLPGNPQANMIFKAYAVQTLTEATSFVQDLKLGHYIKVPPRATFLVQLVATLFAAFVQVGVKEWMFTNVKDICSADQPSGLTCPHNKVFYTASAVWGLIGPSRQFGPHSIYHPQLYAIIIGALLPIPFWLWQRKHKNSWVRYVSTPIVLNGLSFIPPATGINYSSWFAVAFVFQYMIRRKNFAWWSKFNYVTSAAMDSGTSLSLIAIFFVLQFPKNGAIVDAVQWWGNTVWRKTADFEQLPFRPVGPEGLPS